MQLSQSKSDAILVGDIQNNKVGIDRENIDFITTLLSTNLYSMPIQSFLRETVANGWDSQVEAGTTDVPLLIMIDKNKEENIEISIRDYGTGLSPERFDTIYKNIGSSTKRESNDFIGCMGIGRFSALACSDIVKIKSFYNKKCYSYLMYKDGRSICIDKTSEIEGDFENGVEISVAIADTCNIRENIKTGLDALAYFEGVYVKDSYFGLGTEFNNRKIHEFESFKVCNMFTDNSYITGNVYVLMGNVLYPIDNSMIFKVFGNHPPSIALKCDIGDLEITPNRENLIYNNKTKDIINKRIHDALDEVLDITKKQTATDWPSIGKWYEYMNDREHVTNIFKFGEDKVITWSIPKDTLYSVYNITPAQTIKGKTIPNNFYDAVKKFKIMSIPERMITYKYRSEQFQITSIRNQSMYYLEDYVDRGALYYLNSPLNPIAKKYFRDEVYKGGWSGALFLNLKDIKRVFFNRMHEYIMYMSNTPNLLRPSKDTTYPMSTIRMIWEDWKENYFKVIPFNNSDVPQSYKDKYKPVPKQRSAARKCVVYTLEDGEIYNYKLGTYTVRKNTDKYDSVSLGKFKGTVIYDTKGSVDLVNLYVILKRCKLQFFKRCLFVEVAASNIPAIQANKNSISLSGFIYSNNRILSKILTAYHIVYVMKIPNSRLYDYSYPVNSGSVMDNKWAHINNIKRIHNTVSDMPSQQPKEYFIHLYNIYKNRGWLNYDMINDAQQAIPYLEMDYKVDSIRTSTQSIKEILSALYLLQNGTCKGDIKTIQGLKNILTKLKLDESTKNSIQSSSDTR